MHAVVHCAQKIVMRSDASQEKLETGCQSVVRTFCNGVCEEKFLPFHRHSFVAEMLSARAHVSFLFLIRKSEETWR